MAKHSRKWDESVYRSYLRDGRGSGELNNYKPWIRVQDFASRGLVTRVFGVKTGRLHHFLSKSESNYFYLLEWCDEVIDIREQFPLLDLDLAISIASDAGIAYPTDRISGFPYVLTCDFIITTKTGIKARTIKHSAELSNPRTLEKLELERRYWKHKGIEWKIVTEYEISLEKARLLQWVYTSTLPNIPSNIQEIGKKFVSEHQRIPKNLGDAALWIEDVFLLVPGSGLQILRYLIRIKEVPLQWFLSDAG